MIASVQTLLFLKDLSRTKKIFVVLPVIGAVSAVLLNYFLTPRYQGRSVSAWLPALQSTNLLERAKAEEAVRGMGKDILPILLAKLSHRDSPVEKGLNRWARKCGVALPYAFSENYQHSVALCGFRALGTTGSAAFTELQRRAPKLDQASYRAAVAISFVSPPEAKRLASSWMNDSNRVIKAMGLRLTQEIEDNR